MRGEVVSEDERVLRQVQRDPAHERHAVDMDPPRRREGRDSRRIEQAEARDHGRRNGDRHEQEEQPLPFFGGRARNCNG